MVSGWLFNEVGVWWWNCKLLGMDVGGYEYKIGLVRKWWFDFGGDWELLLKVLIWLAVLKNLTTASNLLNYHSKITIPFSSIIFAKPK